MIKGLKIDFHTHSVLSYDGGIPEHKYIEALDKNILDYIAITDHNEVDFALMMQDKYGERFIVGEEIMTNEGEIIGLFLQHKIPARLSIRETITKIREQNGIVYIPHPFDVRRKALGKEVIESVLESIDIFEVFNQRTLNKEYNLKALDFGSLKNLVQAVGSDSHSFGELGKTFVIVGEAPTRENLISLLKNSKTNLGELNIINFLAPSINKVRKKVIVK
jgi:predicted metal-dependent phosphoesterase TrpH